MHGVRSRKEGLARGQLCEVWGTVDAHVYLQPARRPCKYIGPEVKIHREHAITDDYIGGELRAPYNVCTDIGVENRELHLVQAGGGSSVLIEPPLVKEARALSKQ